MKNKRRLRILYLTLDKYPPFRADVVDLFAREFVALGHRVDWIFQSNEAASKTRVCRWFKQLTIVTPKKDGGIFYSLLNIILARKKEVLLYVLVKKNKYDAIQVRDDVLCAIISLLMSRFLSIPFIYWMSFPYPDGQILSAKEKPIYIRWLYSIRGYVSYFFLYKIVMRFSHHNFVQSVQMKKDLEAIGVKSERMSVVPMGVQTKDLNGSFNNNKSMKKDKYTIGYLGTLVMTRKLDFLVDILHEVMQIIPQVKLLLVGDGESIEDREAIIKRAKHLGVLEHIEITGMLPRNQAWRRIEEADVCLSPFYPIKILLSTSPTKLVEYMAIGKPVVANDHPEQSLVIQESGAGISVGWDKKEFSEAIIKMLQNPDLVREMGIKGKTYVDKNRSYVKIAGELEQMYLKTLDVE